MLRASQRPAYIRAVDGTWTRKPSVWQTDALPIELLLQIHLCLIIDIGFSSAGWTRTNITLYQKTIV